MLLSVALVRGVSAQAYPVNVIENPPFEPQSAFVSPVGDPEPFVGYRNWAVFINHDPAALPGLSQVKSYNVWTNRVGIDSIHSVYIVSKVNATTGQTLVSIGTAPGNRFVNAGPVVMSSVPAERAGLVIVDPVQLSGDFNGPLEAHRFQLIATGDLAGDVFLAPHFNRVSTLEVRAKVIREGLSLVVSTSENGILGLVERVEATNGAIGTSTSPVILLVDGTVKLLRAGEINAIVGGVAAAGVGSFVLSGRRIETYTAGGHSGAFTGLIDAQQIEDTDVQANWIKFAGTMQGIIRLGYGFRDLSSNPAVQNYIQVPPAGLQGQIIMRALGGIDELNPWLRPVYVGAQTTADDLNPKPHYLETSGEIGGGAVGRVPYGTHFTDCFPAFTAEPAEFPTLEYSQIDDKHPIQVRYYGPVILPAGGQRAFKVERRRAGSTDPWLDETGCITESLDAIPTVVDLTPERALQAGFEYRVTQELDGGNPRLKCDLVVIPSSPPPVALFGREFRFTICGESMGNADSNGCVNFADVTSVLENFGLGPADCNKNGDADRDGEVDYADVTAVMSNWLTAYCGGACASGFGPDPGDGLSTLGVEGSSAASAAMNLLDALMSMGYASIDAFVAAISGMDEESRNAEVRRFGDLVHGEH